MKSETNKLERSSKKYHCVKKYEQYLSDLYESYAVLSDRKLRAFYDHFGYNEFNSKWKVLLMNQGVNSSSKSQLEKDIRGFIFENNRLVRSSQREGKENNCRGWWRRKIRHVPEERPDLEVELEVTLEDLYMEKSRAVTVERKLFEPFSAEQATQKATKKVLLGYFVLDCEEIRYKGEGHSFFENGNSDLVIRFRLKESPDFKRHGLDIIFKKKISLKEALTSTTLSLTHLDGRIVSIPLVGVISPQKVIKIPGKGFVWDQNKFEFLQLMRMSEHLSFFGENILKSQLMDFSKQTSEKLALIIEQNERGKRVASAKYKTSKLLEHSKVINLKQSKSKKIMSSKDEVKIDVHEPTDEELVLSKNVFDFYFDINVSKVDFSKSSSLYNSSLRNALKEDYCNSVIRPVVHRGDLYVIFEIQFPTQISKKDLNRIKGVLEH